MLTGNDLMQVSSKHETCGVDTLAFGFQMPSSCNDQLASAHPWLIWTIFLELRKGCCDGCRPRDNYTPLC